MLKRHDSSRLFYSMAQLELRLFGSFQLLYNQQPVTRFRSDKARALLAYLVLEGAKPVYRTQLSDLLWSGYREAAGRISLRTALYNLRQALAPLDLIQTTTTTVQFHTAHVDFFCDALALPAWLASQATASPTLWTTTEPIDPESFLQELGGIDSEPFCAWRQAQCNRFRWALAELQNAQHRPTAINHNLPTHLPALIGWNAEIEALCRRVLAPLPRLITIVGEAAVGKTRLALAVAEAVQAHFADGVWFVAFANLPATAVTSDKLAATIGAAMQLIFRESASFSQQLFAYLQTRQCLFVLDGFEHLLPAAHFIIDLLQAAPGCQVLVTSRQRLNFQAEFVFRVNRLARANHTTEL